MSSSKFDASERSLGEILREESLYVVPNHQRDFSWSTEQVEEYFTDIDTALSDKEEEYFIGLMVFIIASNKIYEILDGQQRLVTTSIILSTIRNIFHKKGFDRQSIKLDDEYISKMGFDESQKKSKLILNVYNRDIYDKYVIHDEDISILKAELSNLKKNDKNRRLIEAIIYCKEKINEYISTEIDDKKQIKKLTKFLMYLLDNVKIVKFSVTSDANAYTLFETLNDRGLDLTILDLIKNHLYGKAKINDEIDYISNKWTILSTNLNEVNSDDFLKHYWTSRFGLVRKIHIFKHFKKKVNTWTDVKNICGDLIGASDLYSSLKNSDNELWEKYNPDIINHIKALEIMKAKQVYPVILSGYSAFDINEFYKLIKMLETFIVRYQLIGEKRTGFLESACSILAFDIYDKKIMTTEGAFEKIKNLYVKDDEFKQLFINKIENKSDQVRFVLSSLEIEKQKNKKQGVGPENIPLNTLTLEHILPKKPGKDWEKIMLKDPNLLKDMLYNYGNCCLLGGINRTLGNKSFNDKLEVFEKSDLFTTNMLKDYKEWNRDNIINRSTYLANLAVSRWRYP